MRILLAAAAWLLGIHAAVTARPSLLLTVAGPSVTAISGAHPGCDKHDIPDAPARAFRAASGEVHLLATHFLNRDEAGPDLLHLRHRCPIIMTGANNDDPAAYDDRAWIASPWTRDGTTVFAAVHNEFHGHLRPGLCPSGRYMDCWYNAVTSAVSHDEGQTFHRMGGQALIAALPYRYDQTGSGHHGYFNPSNIVSLAGQQYMFLFATRTLAQQEGNCLLRTTAIESPDAWRAWDGGGFRARFINPYVDSDAPSAHICAPVAPGQLRWPVTSLVRHIETGLFIATMRDGVRPAGLGGGVYYATSDDLLTWTEPLLLLAATDPGTWRCGEPPPIAYPSVLDPMSPDRSFETIGSHGFLFATRFNIHDCRTGMDRELIRWPLDITVPIAIPGSKPNEAP